MDGQQAVEDGLKNNGEPGYCLPKESAEKNENGIKCREEEVIKMEPLENCHNSTGLNAKRFTLETTLKCLSAYYDEQIAKQTNPTQNPQVQNLINSSFIFKYLARKFGNPTQDHIYNWISPFFFALEIPSVQISIMMVYVERVFDCSKIPLTSENWTFLLLGALLISTKAWDDLSIWNADFASVYREVSARDLNILERFFLKSIDYHVGVPSNLFEKKALEFNEFVLAKESEPGLKSLSTPDAALTEGNKVLKIKT